MPDPLPDQPSNVPADDAQLAEQAAQWLVQLSDDDIGSAEHQRIEQAYAAWKQADPRHARVAQDMEKMLGGLRSARKATDGDSRPARAALDAARDAGRKDKGKDRRGKGGDKGGGTAGRTGGDKGSGKRSGEAGSKGWGGTLSAALLFVSAGWLTLHSYPPDYVLADLRTSTGEWHNHTLADGTQITLNSRSAVNMHYDESRRVLQLVQGEILVNVARDATRPFIVETAHGSIRALGTRFTVRREADATILSMLQSRVAVQTAQQRSAQADAETIVEAGQRVTITADSIGAPEPIEPIDLSAGWQHRQLVINDQPLPDVLDELARQRRGHIQYQRADIAHIRVSAVLPLHDTTQALQLLKNKFPQLRIRTITPLLVMVDVPGR